MFRRIFWPKLTVYERNPLSANVRCILLFCTFLKKNELQEIHKTIFFYRFEFIFIISLFSKKYLFQYEGNSTWIKSTLEGFADVCLEKAQKLENLTKTNDTTSSGEGKSIFALISESTCAANCSGHGQCVDGTKFPLNCLANRSYAYFSPSRKTKRKLLEFTVDDIFIIPIHISMIVPFWSYNIYLS